LEGQHGYVPLRTFEYPCVLLSTQDDTHLSETRRNLTVRSASGRGRLLSSHGPSRAARGGEPWLGGPREDGLPYAAAARRCAAFPLPPSLPSSSGKPSSSSGASSSSGRSDRPGFLVDPATSDAASDRLSSVDGDNSDRPAFNLPTVVEESRHQSGRSVAGFMRSRTQWIPLQNLVGGRRPTMAGAASQGDSVHWSMNASSESDSAAERASARAARNASGPFHPFQLYRGYFSGIGSSSSSSSSDPGRLPPRNPRKRFVESAVQQEAHASSSSAPPTCRAIASRDQ